MAVKEGFNTVLRQIKLNTGASMPILGAGTWALGDNAVDSLQQAIKMGYRLIDCAEMYKNEELVGKALNQSIDNGVCKREDLFLTSKLSPYSLFPNKMRDSLHKTLADLKTDYLDLYLIHWPHRLRPRAPSSPRLSPMFDYSHIEPYRQDWMNEIWAILESYVNAGTIKAIGMSNFTMKQIDNLLESSQIAPAVCQVENHLYFQQSWMKKFLDSKGIAMQAYSPLGSPFFTEQRFDNMSILKNTTLSGIARKHGITSAQTALAFLMADNKSVIPKTANGKRLRENFDSLNIQLDEQDLMDLRDEDKRTRLVRGRFLIPISLHDDFWDREYEMKCRKLLRENSKIE